MPDFPIVDTHVHLWDPALLRYPWLNEAPALKEPHLPTDFRNACGPVAIDRIVFVQCECDPAQNVEEAAFIAHLARTEDDRIQGIVAQASLEMGDAVRSSLEALAQNPLVKGIRRLLQQEPVEFCLQPDFVRGVQLLPEYGFSFDICIFHGHLANILTLVRQCPEVRFILDHIGKPDIKGQVFEPWKSEIATLASFPNVWCKVSGVVTEADMTHWKKEDLKSYIDHVITCFGTDRVIYGGDWPVLKLASDYPRWVEALDWAVAGLSADERRKLYAENAVLFYRLPG
ncbi:MAG: amidohydrolase family protein [candidate division Zixibacteria bacterium]|nr:amidohydrolase family protein [candidate division Zixibacteria bacterium]